MDTFKAMVVEEHEGEVHYEVKDVTVEQLSAGDVLIQVAYSSVNYKDMLAVQTKGGVIRNYPMIPGIDLSGIVLESADPRFEQGQEVLVTGFAMGMSHTGGFAEIARVPADWVVPLPAGLTLKDAMIFGTAGLTAALSIAALEKHGMAPDAEQTILVTGSTGGVGSIALQILAKAGYKNIHALVRKENQEAVAKELGATTVVQASTLEENKRPLNKQVYHYILDTVGGDVAASLIPYVYYGGSMSLCGNAGGIKLNTTVLPFILRGVNLLGIDSVNISMAERTQLWTKMAQEWQIAESALYREITLTDLPETIDALKQGQHLGRTIIKYN